MKYLSRADKSPFFCKLAGLTTAIFSTRHPSLMRLSNCSEQPLRMKLDYNSIPLKQIFALPTAWYNDRSPTRPQHSLHLSSSHQEELTGNIRTTNLRFHQCHISPRVGWAQQRVQRAFVEIHIKSVLQRGRQMTRICNFVAVYHK